jgi:20S proteasome alpha/beta subunit
MTCIIGCKCVDGVVLVADRRVINYTESVQPREKIFMDFHPFVVASSGSTTAFDNFRKDAKDLAIRSLGYHDLQQQKFTTVPYDAAAVSGAVEIYSSISSINHPAIPLHSYLDGLKNIVKKYKSELRSNSDYSFDVLIASRAEDSMGVYLSYIDDNGMMEDVDAFRKFIVIGSYETRVAAEFLLKPLSNSNMTMNQFAELAYFIIKYVDRFKTDVKVGLEGQRPLVFVIPIKGDIGRACDNIMERLESHTNDMLGNIEKYGISKLL